MLAFSFSNLRCNSIRGRPIHICSSEIWWPRCPIIALIVMKALTQHASFYFGDHYMQLLDI